MNASVTPPTHSIPLNKQIFCFELSQYECFSNLFVAALQHKIVLGQISFPVSVNRSQITHHLLMNYYYFAGRK